MLPNSGLKDSSFLPRRGRIRRKYVTNIKVRSVTALVMQASGSLVEVYIFCPGVGIFDTLAWNWGGGGF